jgi:hypothetical protein
MPLRRTRGVRVPPSAPSALQTLVRFQQQVRPKWCWAACVSMVLDSLQRQESQCDVAQNHLGVACCPLPEESCVGAGGTLCDQTRTPEEIDRLWVEKVVPAQRRERALTPSELDAQIVVAKRPVMVWLEGINSTFDHVMLVAGKLDASLFIVADPCLHNFTAATHAGLVNARGGWTRTWINL